MTNTDGNVIHADFGKRPALASISVQMTHDILYKDEAVMLVRSRIGVNGTITTTHFLGHRAGDNVELIPVKVDA